MNKRIIRREYKPEQLALLETLHPLLRKVYAARQVKSINEVETTFEQLAPFQSLKDIELAVQILSSAITTGKKILIVGDFDADGATSTALAMRALKGFGVTDATYLVPNRFAYGYGLTPELVAAAKVYSPDVIITVDNGIANHAGVMAAKEQGIQVVITDHHLPSATLPVADAIVNPNQPGDAFPSKNLAGVGVIFYVMLALRRHLLSLDWFTQKKIPEPNMGQLLDLVALGTVADLVPLDQNNRILVHQGLIRMRKGRCIPAIVALLELSGRDFTRVCASDLGFAVASRLNAAGRLDDMSLGIECLLSDDPLRAREMARVLDRLNSERRSIEKDMQIQALEVLEKLQQDLQGEMPKGICLFDPSWHQGVIGILAARIKEKFNRPVIVFAPGSSGELKGSARSINGLHIRDVLALIDGRFPQLILKFGGHAMAAGLTIKAESLREFSQLFDQVVSNHLTEDHLQHYLFSDGELSATDFSLEVAQMLRDAGPWGQAFPEPLFDDTFRIMEQRIVADKHLKLRLQKEDKIVDGVHFFVNLAVWPNHRCEFIKAAYRLDVNEYKTRRNMQLILEHIEAVG